MNLLTTPEQRELAATVRSLLADHAPSERVRTVAESADGFDRPLWDRMAGLGLTGLTVAAEHGGAGAGRGELAAVLEETGAALTPVPLLESVRAADLLAPDPSAADALGRIASGTVATVAHAPDASVADGVLTGAAPRVPFGAEAEVVVVVAADGVYLAEPAARTPLVTVDLTRPQARLEFASPAVPVRTDPAHAADLAAVALAAEQLGGMRHCLATIVVEYAKLRVQFGRFVGSFQGVKHQLADLHCALEEAESITRYATWAADEAPDELPVAASLAQSYLGRAYYDAAKSHLLLHGGIGFTWEHDAHLYYKRAKTDESLLGTPHQHRARLAEHLDLTP